MGWSQSLSVGGLVHGLPHGGACVHGRAEWSQESNRTLCARLQSHSNLAQLSLGHPSKKGTLPLHHLALVTTSPLAEVCPDTPLAEWGTKGMGTVVMANETLSTE